jgi:competence protein ComFB
MAKKSNKTEHVLKLITKADNGYSEDELFTLDQEISSNGTLAVKNTVQAEPGEAEEGEINLSVIQPEQEIKYETKLKIEIEPEIEIKPGAIKQAAETPAKAPVEETPVKAIVDESPVKAIVDEAPARESVAEISVKEPEQSPVARAFLEQENKTSVVLEPTSDLVNIAEILAREKLSLVMERMKVCTCKTCVNDVLALALNSLPTKYVTTDAGKQYCQLDVYKKQYETDILAALTKACVRVKAAPRH